MDPILDFDAKTFLSLSLEERVKLCRELGRRARALGDDSDPTFRRFYEEIARQWIELAAEMEQA
jgi:hypothetical protein